MSDDHVQGSPSPSPQPCANGCPFFGSPSTMNMCSKCFREYRRSNPQEQQQSAATESSLTAVSVETPTPRSVPESIKLSTPMPAIPSTPDASSGVAVDTPLHSTAPASSTASASEDVCSPPPRKIQKNTSRCWSCRKKIGLTGFKCYCGYFFCSEHRYSDKHECDYDYQASQREQLSKANPIVVASKLEKI